MINFFSRLDEYMKKKGLNDNKLTVQAGISNGIIGKARKRGALSHANISKILHTYPELNANWLFTGQGEMCSTYEEEPLIEKNTKQPITILVVNVRNTSNYIANYQKQEFLEKLETITLPKSVINEPVIDHRQYYAFQVIGNSMHPTIYNNDFILAKLLTASEWVTTKQNYIHIIISKSRGVVIKRVENQLKDKGIICCKSDNKYYSQFNIDHDDILQIFEVKCKLSFNLAKEEYNIYEQLSKIENEIEELKQNQLSTHTSKYALE